MSLDVCPMTLKEANAFVEQHHRHHRAGDGLHTKRMKVSGLPSKEKAIEAWNRRADNDTN